MAARLSCLCFRRRYSCLSRLTPPCCKTGNSTFSMRWVVLNTNGFTAGCNSTIKVIKRVAYGYSDFHHNFRRCVLLTLNAKKPHAA